jgi:hypothetical protein
VFRGELILTKTQLLQVDLEMEVAPHIVLLRITDEQWKEMKLDFKYAPKEFAAGQPNQTGPPPPNANQEAESTGTNRNK